jgi:hypothetical protein
MIINNNTNNIITIKIAICGSNKANGIMLRCKVIMGQAGIVRGVGHGQFLQNTFGIIIPAL